MKSRFGHQSRIGLRGRRAPIVAEVMIRRSGPSRPTAAVALPFTVLVPASETDYLGVNSHVTRMADLTSHDCAPPPWSLGGELKTMNER